ncbi:MAG: hypothetical protein QM758_07675 [Armatimonas sp.]
MAELTDGAQLHDRATRGESLTEAEQARLKQWYEEQDAAEAAMLAAHRPIIASDNIAADLPAVLAKIRETAANIETLHQQNAVLRAEIAAVQKRLTAKAA